MVLNVQKTKVMTTANKVIGIDWIWWETFGQVTSFVYLGAVITSDAECKETQNVRCRLGRGRSVMHKRDKIWSSKQMTVAAKKRLLKAIMCSVATYGSESWTYKKDLQWKIEAFELAGYCKILRVSWTQKKSNKWVLERTTLNCCQLWKSASWYITAIYSRQKAILSKKTLLSKQVPVKEERKTMAALGERHWRLDGLVD